MGAYRWKRRWFSMVGNKIYYSEEQDKPAIGYICLSKNCIVNSSKTNPDETLKDCSFLIQSEFDLNKGVLDSGSVGRVWNLCAYSVEEKSEWIEAIQNVISGKRKRLENRKEASQVTSTDVQEIGLLASNPNENDVSEKQLSLRQDYVELVCRFFNPDQLMEISDFSHIYDELENTECLHQFSLVLNQQRVTVHFNLYRLFYLQLFFLGKVFALRTL